MPSIRTIHTPDGFRDLYGKVRKEKIQLMGRLEDVFASYGYEDIETPTVEYFDVFASDIGTTPSNELYKFFDRDGNTLVLRPDFTPSIARAAAMHLPEEAFPARLSYSGSTFVNAAEYQGRLKESTQMGVELIGDGSADADAEILSMTADALKASGLSEFQVSVGQVEYFKGIMEAAEVSPDRIEEIRQEISRKSGFVLGELLAEERIDPAIARVLERLPGLFGDAAVLEEAWALAPCARARAAVEHLKKIHALLSERGLERFIGYDFGLLTKYNYYTGIIFSAFTYGTGEPVARGGRYDRLLGHFGREEPAVGFGIYIDQLRNALARQAQKQPGHPLKG